MKATRGAGVAIALATGLPMLMAFNFPPSPTLLGQCLALGLWGGATVEVGRRARLGAASASRTGGAWTLHGAILCCIAAGALAVHHSGWPMTLALSTLAFLLAFSAIVQLAAVGAGRAGADTEVAAWFLVGLLVAGLISAAIGVLQVVRPDAADGAWIARSALPGRAVGNLRQPNHLSSLLLWSTIAAIGLVEMRHLRPRMALAAAAVLLCGLVLTGSRTAILGIVLLALWGALDRRLSRPMRVTLVSAPLAFGLMWLAVSGWAQATEHAFGGQRSVSFAGAGDISSSRFAIWSNTLALIAHEPFVGVGLGEFNLAWTLSAFPDRPTAFFDHTHNLVLQLLVELGVPLGSAVIVLLLSALWQAQRRAWAADGDRGVAKRTAFMLVAMIGLHSQLEYPLWYAYFLLPSAFAWGCAISAPPGTDAEAPSPGRLRRLWIGVGAVMVLGAAAAALDYRRVVEIYEPADLAPPLAHRVALGQRSLLHGHHADYAAATAFGEPTAPLSASQELAFRRAPHQLLDVRLMIAWAQALAAQGEIDKARWLAARIREFRNPGAAEFFAPCEVTPPAPRAFQCEPPSRAVHWREFVVRR